MHTPNSLRRPLARVASTLLVAVSAFAALLAGCGGGVGTGGTGTYASGPITGLGSIIVNGVRFDDSSASVLDDDDTMRAQSALKLGMTVAIDSDAIRTEPTGRAATASRIRFGSAIVGAVESVDRAAGTLRVIGQTVRVGVETVFDERLAGGLAGIAPGQLVEIYAQFDAAGVRYNATRIEPVDVAVSWQLRGPIAALDSVARTLRIGGTTFTYAGATGVPAAMAVGTIVRLRLQPVPDAGGRYTVTAFGIGTRAPQDRDEAELKGLITALTSSALFSVNGVPVDASAAQFPDGTAGLVLGARVEAKGRTQAGILLATSVSIETEDEVRDQGFEFHGSITAVNLAAKTFELRGVTVSWARPDLRLEHGTLADIVVGRKVEVKAQPSADRTMFEATKIEFE